MLFVYDKALSLYRLSPTHPMQPERFTLAVDLLDAWGMLSGGDAAGETAEPAQALVAKPPLATDDELALAHSLDYIDFVKQASEKPDGAFGRGIGMGDTPAFIGMHEAAALAAGASIRALEAVASGAETRSCNLAGGLHHATYDHASGFCIYNDVVAAIKKARASRPDMRIAYVDIDAHHGDGVEAAFVQDPMVLTASVHESGRYLFPGTGDSREVGIGEGVGSALNVPLPPTAGPESYLMAWSDAVLPALVAFGPDIIVLQGGADSHRNDPLTHLGQTVAGYAELVSRVLDAARTLCSGRAVLLGGGGYRTYDEVPRMWASAVMLWLGRDVPPELPDEWLARSAEAGGDEGCQVKETLAEEPGELALAWDSDDALAATRASIAAARQASPLFQDSAAGSFDPLEEQLADLVDRELDAGI